VLGREFAYETLKALGAIEDEALQDGLSRLVDAELLYQRGRPPRSKYIFKHALVQDAAYQSLLRRKRQHYHQQIAELLETSFPETVENTPELVAHHFTEAGSNQRAVAYWQKAGERALAAFGYEEALDHFQRGLTLKEGQPTDAETASLMFGLGRAQVAALEMDQMSEALDNFRRAFDFFAENGDIPRAVSVAEYPLPMYLVLGQGNRLADLTIRALSLVPDDSKEAGRLLSRYGFILYSEEGNYKGALSAFDQSLAIAQREKDRAVEMQTLISAANVEFYQLHWLETADKSARATKLARSVNDTRSEVYGRYYATAGLSHLGDLEKAREQAEAMVRSSEKLQDRFWLAGAFWMSSRVYRLKGDWQTARSLLDRGLAASPRDFRLLADRVVLEFEVGEFSQGEHYLHRFLDVVLHSEPGPSVDRLITVHAMGVIGYVEGVTDHFDRTEEFAESVISSPSATGISDLYSRVGLALLAVQRGDVNSADEQYVALRSKPSTLTVYVTNHRVLGLLAQTLGQLDDAVAHFEDGLTFCRESGCRPELAWTCYGYADTLLHRNGPGDRPKAISLLDEGLEISRELGMCPLTERILNCQDHLEDRAKGVGGGEAG
jgi:tetratricopeptide (TPR) repeat protein